ncbi:hypothetical protein [Chryseobacterium tongliaoense]|uniref:hypothetical protein n=1 Tax=Chryseobacterium tongliaoense TaxID=3240933 RepID=UPI0035124863
MKNKIFTCLFLSTGSLAFAQVGINTPNPQATLDVVAKNATGTARTTDGLLVPRVDRQRAQSMTEVITSTLVYVNNIATGTAAGTAININNTGYYYFDGSVWVKINSGPISDNTIYNINGSLTGNRVVTQGKNTLAFNSDAVNGFSVDGSTFSVDAVNNRVGIGTAAPNSDLQVLGNEMRLSGPASQTGSVPDPVFRIHSNANTDGSGGELRFSENDLNYGYYIRHNTAAGAKYGYDGLAIGSAGGSKYAYNPARPGVFVADNQDIGFGTATPQQMFHIDGARDNNINSAPTAAQLSNDVVINRNGNVGIGTISPNSKLDLGGTNDIKKLAVYNNAAGDDFYGLGAAGGNLQFRAGTKATEDPAMVLRNNGRIGIGTTNPQTTFHTLGTIRLETGAPTAGMVLTSTDSNGTAVWKAPVTDVVVGTRDTNAGIDIPFIGNSSYRYTGRSITLPPGRWMVTITQLAHTSGALNADEWMFVRSSFTDQNVAIGVVAGKTSDIQSPSLMSFRVQGPGTASNSQQFDVFQGTIIINNTTAGNKTYRYIAGDTVKGGTATPATKDTVISKFGGSWQETSIYATAIK